MSDGQGRSQEKDGQLDDRQDGAAADDEHRASQSGGASPRTRNASAGDPQASGEDPDDAEPASKKPSLIRRHPFWMLFGLFVIAAVAVAGYFAWLIYFHPYETTDDAFVDARSIAVSAKVSGYVSEVPVTDNLHIQSGATILKIDPRDYQTALDQANAQVEAAQATVASADAEIDASEAAVDEATAHVTSTQAARQFAEDENGRQKALVDSGVGTVQSAQQARSNFLQTQAAFQQAQAALASSVKNVGVSKAHRANAVASLHLAEAQVEEARQNLDYTTISSDQTGRIVQLTGGRGQYLQAGQAVAIFVPDELWVTANFKETQIADMRPGQPVDISIDAYPQHLLKGRIDSIQPGSGTAFSLLPAQNATGNYVKVTQRIPVKIVLDAWPKDVSIGPGMSVVPTVTVRPRS